MIFMACVLLHGCGSGDSPEDEVRRWLADAQAAVEAEDSGTLVNMLADNYTDARGNDKNGIDQALRFWFLRQDSIVLISNIEDIRISGDTAAQVTLKAGMAGSNDAAFGFSADAYGFELELEKDGGEWLLVTARWGELGEKVR